VIAALVRKDIKLFFRNQFFTVVTILGIVAFIGVFYLMPGEPDDTIAIAVYLSPEIDLETRDFLIDTLEAEPLPSEGALYSSVEKGDHQAGVVLTAETIDRISRGEPVELDIFTAPGTSMELEQALKDIFTVGFNNLLLDTGTNKINVDDKITVLGPDLLGIGESISLRDRMLPLLILTTFSIELMGLANLISEEVERKTVQALLVTPLTSNQFFLSKVIMGIGLALIEVFLIILATGNITTSPGIVFAALLTGSLMITGVAFLIASIAKDLLSVLSWSTLFLLVLSLPGISIIFPTMTGSWIKVIPSFYLSDVLNKALNYGSGWKDSLLSLGILGISGLVMLFGGSLLLKRRLQ
jgi:ABC-2 type transport system permease protein